VSSLWTPDGERPVGPTGQEGPPPGAQAPPGAPEGPPVDDEELAEQVQAMREELANAPVEVVIANHCYGLFELAAVYLSQVPPLLPQARLAIDALGALVGGLEHRLGDAEEQLRDGLSQLRLAYVQIDGAQRAGDEAVAAAGANGAGDETPDDAGGEDAGTETADGADAAGAASGAARASGSAPEDAGSAGGADSVG